MAKQCKYASSKGGDEVGQLSEKLSNDLRGHIRNLGHFPMFSSQWCDMADVLGRVASISDVESRLAASKEDATLWETEELALRYLLEDGKLNLCLRNLVEYIESRWEQSHTDLSPQQLEKGDKFEKGLGVVLKNAWQHVEAVQTTNIQLLMNHIGDVLDHTLIDSRHIESLISKGDVHQRQEVMIFYYIVAVMRQLDFIQQDRVVTILRDRNIFMQCAQCLEKYHSSWSRAVTLTAIEALVLIADSEDFSTYKNEYVKGESDAHLLNRLFESCLRPFQKDFTVKRMMRPLTDCIAQFRRKYK